MALTNTGDIAVETLFADIDDAATGIRAAAAGQPAGATDGSAFALARRLAEGQTIELEKELTAFERTIAAAR